MKTINERIQWIIDTRYHGNKKRFAIDIGVSTSAIDGIVGGRQSSPSYQVLRKISSKLGVSADWLLNGDISNEYSITGDNSVSLGTNIGTVTNHIGNSKYNLSQPDGRNNNDIIDLYSKMISDLTEQLRIKDEQLKAKDEQLKAKDEQLTRILSLLNSNQ